MASGPNRRSKGRKARQKAEHQTTILVELAFSLHRQQKNADARRLSQEAIENVERTVEVLGWVLEREEIKTRIAQRNAERQVS